MTAGLTLSSNLEVRLIKSFPKNNLLNSSSPSQSQKSGQERLAASFHRLPGQGIAHPHATKSQLLQAPWKIPLLSDAGPGWKEAFSAKTSWGPSQGLCTTNSFLGAGLLCSQSALDYNY